MSVADGLLLTYDHVHDGFKVQIFICLGIPGVMVVLVSLSGIA